MNNKKTLMFHEVLDDLNIKSGWNLETKSKYTISCNHFRSIIKKYKNSVNYSFDDGGKSNLYAAIELEKRKLKGIFFISTHYIGKDGFLTIDEINRISKNHYIYSHGHKHIMKKVSFNDLKEDWYQSIEIMKKNNFRSDIICLPGGFFSRNHLKVFQELKIKYVFHSASSNLLFNTLYRKKLYFYPRIIVDQNFNSLNSLNYTSLKSHIKQGFDFLFN